MADQNDGVDNRAWQRFCTVISAVNSGKRSNFDNELESWRRDTALDERQKIGLYLLAAVKYQIRRFLRHEPEKKDLSQLAKRCYPHVTQVLTAHPMAVEDALRIAFDLPPLKREMSPAELTLVNAGIVGSLLSNPDEEFPELRKHISEWWRINAQAIRRQGGQA